jgi:hypothetical protein
MIRARLNARTEENAVLPSPYYDAEFDGKQDYVHKRLEQDRFFTHSDQVWWYLKFRKLTVNYV